MNILKEPERRPVRMCLYGTPGIGKTTFAAACPNPLLFDLEGGAGRVDVHRVPVKRWGQLIHHLTELADNPQHYETVVIDTLDAAERMLCKEMIEQDGRESIESYGYGKGFTMLGERFRFLIEKLDVLWEMGFNIVLLAQSGDRRKDEHEQGVSYDEWDLKLNKKNVMPLVIEWVDALLFARYNLKVVERDGKRRSVGGEKRIIKTTAKAGFNAKNRFRLPPEMPLSAPQLVEKMFISRAGAEDAKNEAKNAPEGEPRVEDDAVLLENLDELWGQLEDQSIERFCRLVSKVGKADAVRFEDLTIEQGKVAENLLKKALEYEVSKK